MYVELFEIEDIVFKYTGLDIRSRSKKRPYINVRKVFINLAYRYTKKPGPSKIANYLKFNHANVIHHSKDLEFIMKSDENLKQLYNSCEKHIKRIIELKYIETSEEKISRLQDKLTYHKTRIKKIEQQLANV